MQDFPAFDLVHIFYSGADFRADHQILSEIDYLIKEDFLSVKSELFTTVRDYYSIIDEIRDDRDLLLKFEGGEIGHIALKALAYRYLIKHYGYNDSEINVEVDFAGVRPDLKTADLKYIVECGNTEPSKIFRYFKIPEIKQLMILPYPQEADQNLFFVRFSPSPDFAEFLNFRDSYKMEEIANLKNR